jgi:elongation factor G
MDAVVRYLPSPLDVPPVQGINPGTGELEERYATDDEDFTALAFKVVMQEGRKLVYARVYAGVVKVGDDVFNVNINKKEKVSRIFRMHANHRERIEEARTGAIVGVVGLKDTSTGHTLTGAKPIILEQIEFYQPVISIAVEPKKNVDQEKLLLTLQRIAEEDPTFVVKTDEDAYQTVVSGMGELHLDVVVRRIKEEFGIELHVGKPQVVYKETVEREAVVEHTFEKILTGMPGVTGTGAPKGWVSLRVSPNSRGEGNVVTSRIKEDNPVYPFISAVEEGIAEASHIGVLRGFPLTDVKVDILDASTSSPELARLTLKMAAYEGFRKACVEAKPALLVPFMSLTVTTPNEFLGDVIGDLNSRKCQITDVNSKDKITVVQANAPLTRMFGYSTDVRSLSQGRASFTMFFSHYDKIENGQN